MEKRLILAVAFSLLILLSWSAFVSKVYHVEDKVVTSQPLSLTPPVVPQAAPVKTEKAIPPLALVTVEREKCAFIFDAAKAAVQEVIFKDYHSARLSLTRGLLLGADDLVFTQQVSSADKAVFVHNGSDKKIIKEFIFSNPNYDIGLDVKIENLSSAPLKIGLPLVLGRLNFAGDPNETRFQDITVSGKERLLRPHPRKEITVNEVKFLALRNRYFCAIVEPAGENQYSAWVKKISPQESEIGLGVQEFWLAPGQRWEQKFHIYLGPQDLGIINKINPGWAEVIHYGSFDIISQVLLQILGFLHRLFRNWGLAIIALSVVIYLLLYPLTLKQMRSMREMQVLQPAIEELRKTCKDNPQKLNKEIMELYRQHKVNPLGGCLPMILQIPVFFALYQALMRYIAIKGASFLWIKDLSQPDRLFPLPFSKPYDAFNLLPILMMLGMVFQQKLSAPTAASGSDEQQKMMLILFPLLFGFIFYNMPSGLVLYWFINSTLTLVYQFRIKQRK